jgi:hypothetical protein
MMLMRRKMTQKRFVKGDKSVEDGFGLILQLYRGGQFY